VYVPHAAQATVAEPKVTRYLLANRRKAGYFLAFGFTIARWDILRDALLKHVATHEVVDAQQTAHGTNYVVDGVLTTPDGRNPTVRTVWFLEAGASIPRFNTAFPMKRSAP
jgi:hypothetical protein